MPAFRKRYVLILASLLILLALALYSGPARIFGIFAHSDKMLLVYALLLSGVAGLMRVLKWSVLLKNVPLGDAAPVQFLGSTISNFTPGKLGEPVKSALLKVKTGIAVSRSLPSIMWERIMDVTVLLLLSAVFMTSFSSSLYFAEMASIIIFAVVLALFLGMLYSRGFGMIVFSLLRRLPVLNRISGQFIESFYTEKAEKKSLLLSFAASAAAWIMDGVVFYLCFLAVGVRLDPVFFIGLISVSALIGIASFLPGGLGSTDAVMIFLLAPYMDAATAVTGVFVARLLTFWFSAFLGWLSFLHLSKHIDMKKILS